MRIAFDYTYGVGNAAEDCKVDGVDVHFREKVGNGPALVAERHKADVLAFPSRQDNARR